MAGISEVGTQSFDFYEGIRIFVPATVSVALGDAVHRTLVNGSSTFLTDSLALAIVAALFVGLFLYFIDLPAKSIVYRTDQPTEALEGLSDQLGQVTIVNAYFVMLDTMIPANIRARSLYMGSIFRIGFETILLGASAALGILLYSLIAEPASRSRPSIVELYGQWAIAAVVAVLAVTLVLQAKRLRPDVTWLKAVGRVSRGVLYSVGWRGAPLVVVGLAISVGAVMAEAPPRLFRVVGPVVLIAVWLAVYTRGAPFLGAARKPADAATSVVLFSLAVVSVIASRMGLVSDGSVLGGRLEYGAWLTLLVIVTIMLSARGHEKRLKGAYSTQRTWLAMNEVAVRKALDTASASIMAKGSTFKGAGGNPRTPG